MAEEIVIKQGRFNELGVTGLQRSQGVVNEEFLNILRGDRGRKAYREMRDNDPVIGAMLYAIEMLIRNVTWRVEGPVEDQVQFLEECIDDMSHTWEDFVAEILSMLAFGFSFHEIVYKRRMGDSRDPTKRSRYSDGRIGWRKLPIRAQESLYEWEFDEDGGVQSFVQVAEPDYRRVAIPINNGLLFRTGMHKGNPEGRSILRNAYRPWYLKRRIENIESVGIERDLAGLPVIERSGEIAEQYDEELKEILRNVRRDEQEGVLLPLMYDEDGNRQLEFKLLSSAGTRQIDVSATIDRYDRRIAMVTLADFMFLGQSKVGSFALSSDKTQLFSVALGAILKQIASVINRHAVPRLFALNGVKLSGELPEVVPGDVESVNLAELSEFIRNLAGAGAPLFPDEDLENHLRDLANLPQRTDASPKQQPDPLTEPPESFPEDDDDADD